MKPHRKVLWTLTATLLLVLTASEAQDHLGNTQKFWEDSAADNWTAPDFHPTPAPRGGIVKLAWELEDYAENYELARSFAWSDASHGGEAFVVLSQGRDRGNGDVQDFTGSLAFRPLILDFNSFSIAMGIGFAMDAAGGESSDSNEPDDTHVFPYWVRGFSVDDTRLQAIIQTVTFSVLASFPEWGLQVSMDLGYTWSELTVDIDKITADVAIDSPPLNYPAVPVVYEDYRYSQRQEGIFFRCDFRKFFNRNYLNFISLSFYTIYNRENTRRTSWARRVTWDFRSMSSIIGPPDVVTMSRVDLPSVIEHPNYPGFLYFPLPDPQDDEAEEASKKIVSGNIVSADLILRLYTIPMDLGYLGYQGISFEFVGSLSHTTGESLGIDFHGIGLGAGAQISFFDVLFFSYSHRWEMNNDQDDSDNILIGIGLYG